MKKSKEQLWNEFSATGAIGAYLTYCAMHKNREKQELEK